MDLAVAVISMEAEEAEAEAEEEEEELTDNLPWELLNSSFFLL